MQMVLKNIKIIQSGEVRRWWSCNDPKTVQIVIILLVLMQNVMV